MPSSKQLRSSCATNTTLNSSPSLSSSNDSMGDSGSSQTIANSPSFDVSTSSGRQPRKLRKQINTKAFKENYFELDITSSSEVQLLQFRTTDTSRSSASLPTTTNKKEVHKPPKRSIMNNNNNQHSPRPPQRKQNQIPTQTLKEESNNKKRKTMDHNVPKLQEAPSAFNTTTSISYNNNVNNHSHEDQRTKKMKTSPTPSSSSPNQASVVAQIQEKVEQMIHETIPFICYLNSLQNNTVNTMNPSTQYRQGSPDAMNSCQDSSIHQIMGSCNETSQPNAYAHTNQEQVTGVPAPTTLFVNSFIPPQPPRQLDHHHGELLHSHSSSMVNNVPQPPTNTTFNDANFQELCKILTTMLERDPHALQQLLQNHSSQNPSPTMVSSHSESVVNPTTHGSLQQQTLPVDLSSLQDLISFSTPILVDQQVLPFQTATTTLTPPIQQVVSNINVQQSLPLDINTLQDLNSLLMLNCMNNGSATSNDDSSPLLNIPSSNMFFHE